MVGLLRGEAAFSPGIAERMMIEFAQAGQQPGVEAAEKALSARQWEILQKVAEGSTYKEVGAAMNITEQTVKYHMGQIIVRLNVENRAQAITHLHQKKL